jgi:hypothetical protein
VSLPVATAPNAARVHSHALLRWDLALYALGLSSGVAAAIYHRFARFRAADYAPDDIKRGVAHALETCDRWQAGIAQCLPGESMEGKRVLELGPGQSLGPGMVLLARGAAEYTGADLLPLAHLSTPELYSALAEATGASPDLVRRARFQLVRFPSLEPLAGTFDVVVSNSTLEHVEDVPATMRSLRRLVKGFMIHHVDASVHLKIRGIDPLNHLRYGNRTFRLMRYVGVVNRLPSEDYRHAALAAGFKDVTIIPSSAASDEYLTRVRRNLARPYRQRQDLSLLTFLLVAR